ncbi:MAG: hypothetical protein JWO46_2989, partial [Nocardioidaceae bacterium]|nr:hypothetical protein [Nocardioidaceae bacterium]
AGSDVQLVARGEHLRVIRKQGLRLETPDNDSTVQVPAADTVADLDLGDDTAVLVAVKGQQTQSVVDDLLRHAPPGITVVSVQNGVANERNLLRTFEHVLGVCVMLPSTHLAPGTVIQNSAPVPGMLDVGCFPGGTDERCEGFAEAVRAAGFDSVVRPDVMAWKHRKLLANLGNAVQATCAPGDDSTRLAGLARDEGARVLAAAGIDVVTAAADTERRGDLLSLGSIGGRGGGSTWQSLARGTGSVESDYLNGEISLLGRLHGLPTPVNDLLRRTAQQQAALRAEPGSLSAADLLASLEA